ncbi:zinc finger protein 568-like isoform X2 [Anneissia japonica]|uniref:zinc finger protein 568-like isoform X2 n=1 Tax=Anneissia japonica TaxID=1529436 RepID=UPI0014255AE5|nr:zinc finger protein 568-like isoform X2 [Anneissia japonica]
MHFFLKGITTVRKPLLNMEFTISLGSAKTFNLFQEAKLKSGQNSDEEFIRQLLADHHELYARPTLPKDRADKDALCTSKMTKEVKRKEKSCVFAATDHKYTSKEIPQTDLEKTDIFDPDSDSGCFQKIDETPTEITPSQKQRSDLVLMCDNKIQKQKSDCARDGNSPSQTRLKGMISLNDNAMCASKPKLVCVTRKFSDRRSRDTDQKTARNISKIGNSGRIKHHLVILNDQRGKTVEKNPKKGKKYSSKAEKKSKVRVCPSDASSDGQNSPRTMFGCKECQMYFSKYEKLSRHIETAHSALLKNGSTCKEFVSKESMSLLNKCCSVVEPKVEFGMISKEEIVEAIESQKKEVQEKRKRKFQERIKILNKELRCTECNRVFKKLYSLRNHIKLHHSDITNLPKCNICNKAFLCKSRVIRHMSVSHSQNARTRVKHPKGFLCETCGATFTQKHTLKLHMNKHANIKPHVCNHCGKKFTWLNALEYHERTHTGERPYPCLLCQQRFKTPSDLKRHQVVHTKEKPFSCSLCSKKFSQRSTLNAHIKNIHRKQGTEPIQQRVAMVDVISLMPNILPDNIHVTLNNEAVAFVQGSASPVVTL